MWALLVACPFVPSHTSDRLMAHWTGDIHRRPAIGQRRPRRAAFPAAQRCCGPVADRRRCNLTYGEPDDYDTAIVVSLFEHKTGTTVYCRKIEDEPPAEVPFVQDGPTLFD